MKKYILIAFLLLAALPVKLLAQDPAYPTAPAALQNIITGEFFVDTDPGFGNGTAISFSAGTDVTNIPVIVPTAALTAGVHRLYLRTLNAEGEWSVTMVRSFIMNFDPAYPVNSAPLNIIKAEQFVDADPGFGNAVNVSLTPGVDIANIPAVINTGALSIGVHRLFTRTLNAEGEWSISSIRSFVIDQDPPYPSNPAPQNIVKAEYFVNTDPGFGNGNDIPVTPGLDLANQNGAINITGLPQGGHQLYIRTLNTEGEWSVSSIRNFIINEDPLYPTAPAAPGSITRVEYFIDTDPGFGNGTSVTITPAVNIADLSFAANVNGLSGGTHRLYIRSLDDWSITSVREFEVEVPLAKINVSGAVVGGFQTLREAFNAINAGGGSGAVTVTIDENTIETAQAFLNQTNYTVQVIPNGNRLVEGNIVGPVVLLNGADNVTIDGLTLNGANTLTFRNTNTDQTANTIRIDGPAENNIVRRCTIEGSCNGTLARTGIVAITAADNGNSVNNSIDSNIIRPATVAGAKNGIVVTTLLTTNVSRINNTQITNNSIENVFINNLSLNQGIVVVNNANNTVIKGNSIYNTTTLNNSLDNAEYRVISITATSGSGAGVTIDSNFVGGQAAGATGNKMTIVSPVRFRFFGILVNDNTFNPSSVTGNTIRNIDFDVTNPTTTATTAFAGIRFFAGNLSQYHHNTVGDQTNNNIILQNKVSSTGTISNFLHLLERPVTNSITDNFAGGVSLTTNALSGSTAVPSLTLFDIRGLATITNFKNNIAGSATPGNINIVSNTASFNLFGIDESVTAANPIVNIDSNIIRNINITGPGSIFPLRHISTLTTTPTINIRGNTISSLTAANGIVRGIQYQTTASNLNALTTISGNNITGLSTSGGTGNFTQGIRFVNNGSNNTVRGHINHNTISNILNASVGAGSADGIAVPYNVSNGDSLVIANNTVSNISSATDVQPLGNVGNSTGIIYTTSTVNLGKTVIRDNVVSAISGTSTASEILKTFGISAMGNNVLVERNRVFGLSNVANSAGAIISPLFLGTLGGDANIGLVRNNMFAINTTTNARMRGIYLESAVVNANIYHNSVLLEGSSPSESHALFFSSTSTLDVRNNILYNAVAGLGNSFAIGAQNAISGYTASNNYLVSPSATTIAEQNNGSLTLAAWQSLTSQDANAEEGVSGVNTSAANLFLNKPVAQLFINTANATEPVKISDKGLALSSVVPEDFLGLPRSTTTPDIGAHEFVFSPPLPLNLLSFTGAKQNSNALLQWRTANEVNVARFELQRSDDGQNFVTIGTVQPGNSVYQYTDLNIFNSRQVAFYRLKSIDIDDKFTYSAIIKLVSEPGLLLTVYPNPVKDVLTIGGLQQNGTIKLFNVDGKLLLQQTVNAQTVTMDMSRYVKGMYILQYRYNDKVESKAIVKQ